MKQEAKLCTRCNRKLALEKFHRQRNKGSGRMARCKKCEADLKNVGDLVESPYNQKVYGVTMDMFKNRFGS